MQAVKIRPSSEASRTGLGLRFLGRLDQAGPLSFEALARAFGSRPIRRVPVTAGSPWGTAMRRRGSARVARRNSPSMTLLQDWTSSLPQGWPQRWRLDSPFSSSPPFSSSWRISFCLPPFSYQLSSTTSSFVMLSSSSFSFRLFSLFSSPSRSPSRLLNKRSPAVGGPDYPTAGGELPPPAC